MQERLNISFAQYNNCVGAFDENARHAALAFEQAQAAGSDLLIFPEMYLCGYPCEDLAYRRDFYDAQMTAMAVLAALTAPATNQTAMIIGGIRHDEQGKIYNSLFLLDDGKITHIRDKVELPNYGVFDEKRIFTKGANKGPLNFRGLRIGFIICEDIWGDEVVPCLAETGAQLVIACNASPYEQDKAEHRLQRALGLAVEFELPIIYFNAIGGQDELVFDGGSFAVSPQNEGGADLVWQAPWFAPDLQQLEFHLLESGRVQLNKQENPLIKPLDRMAQIHGAIRLGLQDYIAKNGFKGVLLGLSGGIDSALTFALCVDALGAKRVKAIYMPSPYSADSSFEDADLQAKLLGCNLDILPIDHGMQMVQTLLSPALPDGATGIAAENIQARLRGLMLMTLSNQLGLMVVTTGNKSEIATGYSTLYGDACGSFNLLKDLYKSDVFALSNWLNQQGLHQQSAGMIIPQRVIDKPPSAELSPNQKDSDSLPDYALLDAILYDRIERNLTKAELIQIHKDSAAIDQALKLLKNSEYKRRQAAPGVKLSSCSFGRDWRYPVTNHY